MKSSQAQKFTQAYRKEGVKLVLEQGMSHAEACRQLGISPKTLSNWVPIEKRGELSHMDARLKIPVSPVEAE